MEKLVFQTVGNIIQLFPGYAYLLERRGHYHCCNESQAKLFGLINAAEIIGKKAEELPLFTEHPHLLSEWLKQTEEVFTLAIPLRFKEVSFNLARELISLSYYKIPLIYKNKVIGLIAIVLPDENKPLQIEGLSSSIITFNHILENLPEHVYWKDTTGHYLGCNKMQAMDLNLRNSEEIIGKTDYDLSPKEKADAFRVVDQRVLDEGKKIETEEIVEKNGEVRTVLSKKIPLYDTANSIIGLLGISFDITQRKEMESALVKATHDAEIASQAKSEFLRNMEHQLRTPFSGVYSLVQMLAETETDPSKKEILEITYQSAKEFLDLLNEIIDFSQNPTEKKPILAIKFSLKELILKVITLQKAAAHAKHLTLHFSYPRNIPYIFINDPYRLQRLLLNLVSNAIRFTNEGRIDIKVKLAKHIDEKNLILQLLVKDTGIGIPEDKQAFIYEKFYRVHPANQNTYTGAGLGLHWVKQIIADLEGEIEVKSIINQGTTFICTLPFQRPLIDKLSIDD